MLFYIFLSLCAFFQGLLKAVSDGLMSGRFQVNNPMGFWGKDSWVRKWKNGNPIEGEAFLGSSTILVWLTDGWHLSNALGMIANVGGLVVAFTMHLNLMFAIVYAAYYWFLRSGTFHVFYTYVLPYLFKPKIIVSIKK